MTSLDDKSKKPLPSNVKKTVWVLLDEIKGHPPDIWRKDKNGQVINWQEYEKKDSAYGWTIVYKTPPDEGGTDDVSNMEAISLSK